MENLGLMFLVTGEKYQLRFLLNVYSTIDVPNDIKFIVWSYFVFTAKIEGENYFITSNKSFKTLL